VKFGFNVPNFGEFEDVRFLARVAAAVEDGGWDGFFIWDHLSPVFFPGMLVPTADTTVALTAIALATSRIRFGPMIAPLPRRRVQKFAREMVSLDRLSAGRLICGVGLGEPKREEYEAFGESPSGREHARRLDESLEVVTALWRGEPVDYDGEFLHVHTGPLLPGPVQQPRIPIWVAARQPGGSRPYARAARWDGVCPIAPNPERDTLMIDDVAAVRERVGRGDGFDIVVNAPDGGDVDAYEAAGASWWIDRAYRADDVLARAKEGPPRT
jgi:alkanesulfonate monooxygenase SsuD/methylene tetrahydromethanopterin reductase-like flavin-dependent oxidoreductase (luciferase family)